MSDFIYHYSSVATLALILDSSTIKFNSLKLVDDIEEGNTTDYGNKAEYVYVSCWTHDKTENIALWNMYAKNMTGIRIGIERDFLKPNIENFNVTNLTNDNVNCLVYDNFYCDIEYTDENSVTLLKEIKEEPEPLEEPGLKYIGTRKKKIWEFQKEVRFVLYASSKNHTKSSSRLVFFESVIKNINKPEIDCLYMKFDRNRFNNAEIILGPRASKTDMIIVESLITKYLPNFIGKVGKSSLGIR